MSATDAQKKASRKFTEKTYKRYSVYIRKKTKYEDYMERNTPLLSPSQMLMEYIDWKTKGGRKHD